jgi:hypothetical protein
MGGIKKLLGKVIETAPHTKLLSVLFKELKGKLDGKPMEVSPDSCGKKLVLKGWLLENKAVSVRYVAEWENPDGGTATYQSATDKTYKATTGSKVVYAGSGGKLSLKLSFTDLAGKAHVAKFYTEIM